MRAAKVIKENGKWKCRFMGKKGLSEKPITNSELCKWLDQNVENPHEESDVEIPDNTQLIKLIYKGKVFEKKTSRTGSTRQPKGVTSLCKYARSPYNFVPLNKKVVFPTPAAIDFSKYDTTRHTGYIELEVKNLTPLFIRQISGDEKHFGYGERYGIPGSSMRGMIRTLCEVLSFGRFGRVQDNRLYYRGTLLTMKEIKAGVLKYENGGYNIYPCSYDVENTKRQVNYPIDIKDEGENGIVFTTGKFGKKYNKFRFFHVKNKPKYRIDKSSKVFVEYNNDVSRDSFNIFEKAKKDKIRVPVFYQLNEEDEINSIGSAKYHRIPYKKSIGEHIPNGLNKAKLISEADLVQVLFGDDFEDGMIASRLSFGDLMSNNAEVYEAAQLLRILSSPKPTTFQHYLEQTSPDKLNDWNSDALIRGFKLYWHRKTKDDGTVDISWNESIGKEVTKSHTDKVKPVKPGATFRGKIWFQNLTDIELGLLLMALEPNFEVADNERIIHKIGLAKPLGLGSIQISIKKLKVFNTSREGYYSSYEPLDKQKYKEVDKDLCKNNFDVECAIAIGLDGGSIWDVDRLVQLRAMMTWKNDEVGSIDWLQKTRYMEIERVGKSKKEKNEFRDRPVLPKPEVVISEDERKFV